jgi:hypothetical protein
MDQIRYLTNLVKKWANETEKMLSPSDFLTCSLGLLKPSVLAQLAAASKDTYAQE